MRAIDLRPADDVFQVDMFNDVKKIEKIEKLDNAVEVLRQRFGNKAVHSAALLEEVKAPMNKTNEITLPGQMHKLQ